MEVVPFARVSNAQQCTTGGAIILGATHHEFILESAGGLYRVCLQSRGRDLANHFLVFVRRPHSSKCTGCCASVVKTSPALESERPTQKGGTPVTCGPPNGSTVGSQIKVGGTVQCLERIDRANPRFSLNYLQLHGTRTFQYDMPEVSQFELRRFGPPSLYFALIRPGPFQNFLQEFIVPWESSANDRGCGHLRRS